MLPNPLQDQLFRSMYSMSSLPQKDQSSAANEESSRKRRFYDAEIEKKQSAKQARIDGECSETSDSDGEGDSGADDTLDLSTSSHDVSNLSQFHPAFHSAPTVPQHDKPLPGVPTANTMFGQFASGHLPPLPWTTSSTTTGPAQTADGNRGSSFATVPADKSDSSGMSSLRHSSSDGTSFDLATATNNYSAITTNKDAVFATLNAKLNLLGSKKYDVTVAEIVRRIQPPEALNSSFLSAYLRRAKNEKMGDELRKDLKQVGVNLPIGRRKNARANAFTSLVEKEAWDLAKDYDMLSKKYFPTQAVAANMFGGSQPMPPHMLKGALDVIKEAIKLLGSDRSPGSEKGEKHANEPGTAQLDPAVQAGLTDFSLRTHGFGVAAHRTAWQSFANVLEAALEQSAMPTAPQAQSLQMSSNGYPMQMPSSATWNPEQMAAAYQQLMYNQMMMGQQLPKWMTGR